MCIRLILMKKPDVFDRRYTYHFPKKLDIAARCSRQRNFLTGTHEFAAYTDKKDEMSTKRTIYAIMVGGQGGRINIQYEGTGFLLSYGKDSDRNFARSWNGDTQDRKRDDSFRGKG